MDSSGVLFYRDALEPTPVALTDVLGGGEGVAQQSEARRFQRSAPAFIDDPDQTELFPALDETPVLYPPLFTQAARDASLIGYRTLLRQDGSFSNDDSVIGAARDRYLHALRQPDPFPNEDTRLRPADPIPTDAPNRFVLDLAGRTRQHLPGRTIALCSSEPSNYGSFLFRILPKLVALPQYAWPDARILAPIPSASCHDYMTLAGLPAHRILRQDPNVIYDCDQVLMPCLRNNQAFLDPESQALYRALQARCRTGETGRRLYVSRAGHSGRGGSSRILVNEAELIDALRRLDFHIVEPEAMSARDQIALFASADLVVGPAGSAMFNAVFCRPGTRLIDIESEPFWIHAHACLFTSCQLDFGIFCGRVDPTDPAPVHRRWTVNIPALLNRIERMS